MINNKALHHSIHKASTPPELRDMKDDPTKSPVEIPLLPKESSVPCASQDWPRNKPLSQWHGHLRTPIDPEQPEPARGNKTTNPSQWWRSCDSTRPNRLWMGHAVRAKRFSLQLMVFVWYFMAFLLYTELWSIRNHSNCRAVKSCRLTICFLYYLSCIVYETPCCVCGLQNWCWWPWLMTFLGTFQRYFVLDATRVKKPSGIYKSFFPRQRYNGNRTVGATAVRYCTMVELWYHSMVMTVSGLVCPLTSDTINVSQALGPYHSTRL